MEYVSKRARGKALVNFRIYLPCYMYVDNTNHSGPGLFNEIFGENPTYQLAMYTPDNARQISILYQSNYSLPRTG